MGTATQWLATEVDQSISRGSTTIRTIEMSGADTTVVDSPVKTRTTTETAVATNVTTFEDEGYSIRFAVILEGGLGKIPAGDTP